MPFSTWMLCGNSRGWRGVDLIQKKSRAASANESRAGVKSGDADCADADHAAGATGAGRSSSHPQAVPAMAATRHPMRAEARRTRWGREMLTLRVLPAEAEAPHVCNPRSAELFGRSLTR